MAPAQSNLIIKKHARRFRLGAPVDGSRGSRSGVGRAYVPPVRPVRSCREGATSSLVCLLQGGDGAQGRRSAASICLASRRPPPPRAKGWAGDCGVAVWGLGSPVNLLRQSLPRVLLICTVLLPIISTTVNIGLNVQRLSHHPDACIPIKSCKLAFFFQK